MDNIDDADIRRAGMFARDTAGTAAIEFAIVAPLLIAIILATLQAALIFLVEAFFESSAEQAARTVLTNKTLRTPNAQMTASEFQTEICTQLTTLFNCSELIVELEPLPAGTTNLASLLPQFNATGNSWARLRSTSARTPTGGNRHAARGDVSLAGLRRPARAQSRQFCERHKDAGVDAGLPGRTAMNAVPSSARRPRALKSPRTRGRRRRRILAHPAGRPAHDGARRLWRAGLSASSGRWSFPPRRSPISSPRATTPTRRPSPAPR